MTGRVVDGVWSLAYYIRKIPRDSTEELEELETATILFYYFRIEE